MLLIDDANVTDADDAIVVVMIVNVGRGDRIGFFSGVNSFGQFRGFARTHLVHFLFDECLLLGRQQSLTII